MSKKQLQRRINRLTIVVILAVIAAVLMGLGFGLWAYTATRSAGDGLRVGEVVNGQGVAFQTVLVDGTDVKDGDIVGRSFIFDNRKDDTEGRIRWRGEDSEEGEKLTIAVSVTILHAEQLTGFRYTLALPQGVLDAAQKHYIDVSDYYNAETNENVVHEISLEDGVFSGEGADMVWSFSFEIALKWGSCFGGSNPGLFYDGVGRDIPDEEAVATLQDLKETIGEGDGTQYFLTLTADAT